MKRKTLRFGKGVRVVLMNPRAEAAEMVIPPGGREGGPQNRHRGADQWLFVVDGEGRARVNGKLYPLRSGALMLSERGDRHEVENTGDGLLRTLNFYTPPAYGPNGQELAASRP